MNNGYAVSTLPIQINANIKFGSMTAPLYADIIARKLSGCSYLYLNQLLSFTCSEETDLIKMKDRLGKFGVHTDKTISDVALYDHLYSAFLYLVTNKYIHEEIHSIYCCECGRVNILKKSIKPFSIGKNYQTVDNKIVCTICGKPCSEIKRSVLVFRSSFDSTIRDIPATPYHDNLLQIQSWLKQDGILISREHPTGIKYRDYNIDVDFFWGLFLKSFNEDNIVLVSSNKHPVKIAVLNELAEIFNKQIAFVIHPQIARKKGDHFSENLEKYDIYLARLFLYYAPKWNTKECYYNVGTIKAIAKLRGDGRKKLWKKIISEFDSHSQAFDELSEWIEHDVSIQKDLKEIKSIEN